SASGGRKPPDERCNRRNHHQGAYAPRSPNRTRRRVMKAISRLLLLTCAGALLTLPACESDRGYSLLGYRAGQDALYDCSIHTVHVPIFQNRTFYKGLEFDLTRAVVREIELKTPYKVVGADQDADAELSGTIVGFTKSTLNVSQINEIRE